MTVLQARQVENGCMLKSQSTKSYTNRMLLNRHLDQCEYHCKVNPNLNVRETGNETHYMHRQSPGGETWYERDI